MTRRLFQVADGCRVRIEAQRVRWVDEGVEELIAENTVWFGTTTPHYWMFNGTKRRLLVDHTLGVHADSGIWQIDCNCFVIGGEG